MKRKAILIGAICAIGFASAQEDAQNLETILLSGKVLSTPYSKVVENVIVIGKEQIKNSPATSIEDLLQQFSGIDVRRRGANGVQSDVSIRGGSFEQVLVLINGVRLNDAQTGHNTMNIPVDLSSVDRIEVFKGPAARKFGNNAYAGVINIITNTSAQETVKISASGGDFSTIGLGLGATFGSEKVQNMIQLGSHSSEGYRYNTDYTIKSAFYQSKILLGGGNLNLQGGFIGKKFGANGFYSSPNLKDQYEETQASIASISYDKKWEQLAFNVGAFWRRGQDMYMLNRANPARYRNISIGNNFGVNANVAYTWSLGTTQVGASVRKEFLSSNNATTIYTTDISIGKKERLITEGFVEHQFSFFDKALTVIPGTSWANISGVGQFFYPGVDVGYSFARGHKIYGNFAKVNRIPSFFDMYYFSPTEQGNANLRPESALSYEAGYQYLKNNFELKASYFARNSKNGIDWVRDNSAEAWRSKNISNIHTQGIDAFVGYRHKGLLHHISLGYTYIDAKLDAKAPFSKYLQAEHFRHQLVAKLDSKIGKYFSTQFAYRYQERIFGYSYHLLDGRLSFKQNDLEVYALINNITNRKYVEAFGVEMPSRWFHIGFNYTIPFVQ